MTATATQPSQTAQAYLDEYAQTHDRANTLANVRLAVARFDAWLGDTPVTVPTLEAWKLSLVNSYPEPSTRNLHMRNVQSFLCWLERRGLIDVRGYQIKDALKPFKIHRGLIEVLDKPQLAALAEAAGKWRGKHPVGALVLAALVTGARRSELTNMPITAIDTVNQKIVLVSTKTRVTREFPLALCGVAAKLFEELKRKNRRLVYEYVSWNEIRKAAGLRSVQFKQFRACFSSYAKSAGANPWLIDKFLAHSASAAEQSYDRALLGITGDDAPAWYGCERVFAEAVEQVQIDAG